MKLDIVMTVFTIECECEQFGVYRVFKKKYKTVNHLSAHLGALQSWLH